MKVQGIVTATKNPRWLRIVPTDPSSELSNAMVAAGELKAGDQVTITITTTTEGA